MVAVVAARCPWLSLPVHPNPAKLLRFMKIPINSEPEYKRIIRGVFVRWIYPTGGNGSMGMSCPTCSIGQPSSLQTSRSESSVINLLFPANSAIVARNPPHCHPDPSPHIVILSSGEGSVPHANPRKISKNPSPSPSFPPVVSGNPSSFPHCHPEQQRRI